MLEIGGIELLPAWPVFLGFVVAGLALNIVPGADMTFIIASAARGGRRDGVIASLGVGTGALIHIFAAVFGLSAILASSQAAFDLIKYARRRLSAVDRLLAAASEGGARSEAVRAAASGWRLFRSAMLVNILNPKVALFFLAFLPQFVDPAASVPAAQILCLGLWFDFVGTLVNIAIAVAAAGTAARCGASPGSAWRRAGWRRRTMGALAVQLALSARRQA